MLNVSKNVTTVEVHNGKPVIVSKAWRKNQEIAYSQYDEDNDFNIFAEEKDYEPFCYLDLDDDL